MEEKFLVFLLCLSSLELVREIYNIYDAIADKKKLQMSGKRLFFFGCSIAYILTIILTGIKG